MFDVFLQSETEQECPDCGGIYSRTVDPVHREDLLFHYGEIDMKDSSPIAQEIRSAFNLLANDEESFFSLCDDPEKLDRNKLEKYLQSDPDKVSRNDPLVHMKEIVSRPILDLKEDEIKQPTSRVKKFAPRALEYLASHSEDWRNKSFVGVHPQQLLSLVREDKWETYENRLLYTLCKTLNTLVNQRLRELKGVDDAYEEIQRYYEIINSVDHDAMQKEVDQLLVNYSSDQVDENRELLSKTIEFLKRLQQSIGAFWNSQLFGNLKRIPNVEVDINRFIMTNILMNNQHYLYLPKIQKEIVNYCSKERSKLEKLEEQRLLLGNEIKFVKRCIDDFAIERQSFWRLLKPVITVNEIGIELKCGGKKLRFSFASSKPSDTYVLRLGSVHGSDNTISILVFPQETPYLDGNNDSLVKLSNMFGNQLPQWGTFSILGISPQSVFSKLLIQRVLLQWAWPILISDYPFKLPQNRFIKEFVTGDYLFNQYDVSSFEVAVNQKEHTDRIKKNDLPTFRKVRDEEIKVLRNANELIAVAQQCPCCGQNAVLSDHPLPQNFMLTCRNCKCRWSRNDNVIKWIKADSYGQERLYGKLENFEVKINCFSN